MIATFFRVYCIESEAPGRLWKMDKSDSAGCRFKSYAAYSRGYAESPCGYAIKR
jgi:hypothetical protein